jgi:hypothetical protein
VRWSAYASTLSSRQFTRIVNLLTTGYGYAYLAARAAENDRPAALVLTRLERSQRHLAEALALMTATPEPGAATRADTAAPGTPAAQLWGAFLQQRARGTAQTAGLLADAVVAARRAADAVQQDADMDHIRQRLAAALAAIVRLLELSGLLALLVQAMTACIHCC